MARLTLEKYKQICDLLLQGHNSLSASKIVKVSQATAWRISQSKSFKKRLEHAQEHITGKIKASLIKRAVGYDKEETKVYFGKQGPEEYTEVKHYPGDVKAQLEWLKAKDKEGGWVQDKGVAIQINQQLQGIETKDLLLTLGGGGIPAIESNNQQNQLPQPTTSTCTFDTQTIDIPAKPFARGYNPDYDAFHEKDETGEGMSDEEYLKEMVQDEEER